jgi:hypothetical protein
LENVVDVHGLQLNIRDRGQVCVDWNEVVASRELQAVAGVIEERDACPVGGAVEALQQLLRVDALEVHAEIDLKADAVQSVANCARIIDRVVKLGSRRIVRVSEDERNASIARKGVTCRLEKKSDRNESRQRA